MRNVCRCSLTILLFFSTHAFAADLVLPAGGRVSISLSFSDAAFHNTLSIVSPAVSIARTGCSLESHSGLSGVAMMSEKNSQHGCRVDLDFDPVTPGIQPFPAGTTLKFALCVQSNPDPPCEHVWFSDPSSNSDHFEHVTTTTPFSTDFPGKIFRMGWEDQENGGDMDSNDLIAVVRVDMDTDGDGLWDDWEKFGIDSKGDGVIDVDLPNLLPVDLNGTGTLTKTSPLRKDIFLQIDYMDCTVAGGDCAPGDTHSHTPKQAAIDAMVRAFANAPAFVTNPDGSTGVTLHVSIGKAIAHQKLTRFPADFDALKEANFGHDNPLRSAFHYALMTHVMQPVAAGIAETPGNDLMTAMGDTGHACAGGTKANQWCNQDSQCPGSTCTGVADFDGDGLIDTDVGRIQDQASTIFHELGHNLGLLHGGSNNVNNKPNYVSIMNYTYSTGIPPTDPDGTGPLSARIDYSSTVLPPLDEGHLNEPAGIGDGTDWAIWSCPPGSSQPVQLHIGNQPLDWNCNGSAVDLNVSSDISQNANVACVAARTGTSLATTPVGDDVVVGNSIREGPNHTCETTAQGTDIQVRAIGPLTGFNDWANLQYAFQNTKGYEDLMHPEVTAEDGLKQVQEALHLPDPAVSVTVAPSPVVTGSNVTYTISVTNARTTGARDVNVGDILSPSLTFVSCTASGGGVCSGSGNNRTITFASIPGGGTSMVAVVAQVNCAVADGTVIANQVSLSSLLDVDGSNNVASVSLTASNPPPVISGVSVDRPVLWPPNHKMVDVKVNYSITDNCGTAASLKVSSNEPVNGTGEVDWEIVDANHVRLRAERAGNGEGRTYTITIATTDSGGASVSKNVTVLVPKNSP